MKWALKLTLYGATVVVFFTLATAALPVIWVADGIAGAYRKLNP